MVTGCSLELSRPDEVIGTFPRKGTVTIQKIAINPPAAQARVSTCNHRSAEGWRIATSTAPVADVHILIFPAIIVSGLEMNSNELRMGPSHGFAPMQRSPRFSSTLNIGQTFRY
jgi:hypothetical protein